MNAIRSAASIEKQEGHRHVRIHPECPLCGCYFEVGEPMIALLGNRSNSTCQVIDASAFPIAIYCNQKPGTPWTFCQLPKCAKCTAELESVTVHQDCFQIFLQQTRAHKHITAYNLWHAAHARYPWRGFWPLPQTILDEDAVSLAMTHAAANWHMPLDMLPNELLLLVCENLRHGVFWRHILAKEFIRKLVAEANNIDSVERLGQISASFKFGLGRLYLQKGMRSLRSWDTPGPPVLPDHQFSPELQPICPRLGTIETQNSFGITFFISSGSIAAIHAHTTQAPSAYSCFQRLNPVKKKWVAWIFVPTRGGIEKFGFRSPLLPPGVVLPHFAGSLLLHMNISGEVVLGPYLHYGMDVWMEDDPTTLIHGISRMGAVYPLGTPPHNEEGEEVEVLYQNPMSLSPPFEHAYFSHAQLDDVASVEIYHDKALRICRGVVVRKTKYLRPGTRVERDSVDIECSTNAEHDHPEDDWACCKFPSRLEWWFTSEESRISFTPGQKGCM
ncbi:hypothetical protein LMH87_011137 [Akanthomyces muscarius]|uniref:Uncharacterized protein n=1 Tax=Akanthomyces muscarius TaxID=2231603 RepID=A0A9W8Q945_AKAMU|nr:hypothetical protein LMH87_011137 [Akanthomyces muscarius]KAJ4150385.1 hypothetical protein LMH87_011137 [Akanthomyces muscarius]